MNKTDLIKLVAQKNDMPNKEVASVLDSVLDVISEALNNDEKVNIAGFGAFDNRKRKERQGQNPSLLKKLKEQGVSGDEAKRQAAVTIPAANIPSFKPAKQLRELVN